MSEPSMAISSAVIVPESSEQPQSPRGPAKRRNSSFSERNAKRNRFSHDGHIIEGSPTASSPPALVDRALERRKSGLAEERKRGQRLFGALLGTLSQSSSSTAQKRRTDIERKQQAKLKLQADEFDEKKKQRLDAILEVRRREQKKYDKQTMQIRHSGLLAQAHFLQTKAEPKLYYKPWELLPGDDDKIKSQIRETEQLIEKESLEHEQRDQSDQARKFDVRIDDNAESAAIAIKSPATVGRDADKAEGAASHEAGRDANTEISMKPEPDIETRAGEHTEVGKEQGDDEMVEGEEDTVIY